MTEDEQMEIAIKLSYESSKSNINESTNHLLQNQQSIFKNEEEAINEALKRSCKDPQPWNKRGLQTYSAIRNHNFLIQQFSCQSMKKILYVGIGCSINQYTGTVYSLVQFKHNNISHPFVNLTPLIKSVTLSKNSFNHIIFEENNIVNLIYDDKVHTLIFLALFSLIESIDNAQQMKFFIELIRLIEQYQIDAKIIIPNKDHISNTTFWRGQPTELKDQFIVPAHARPQQELGQQSTTINLDEVQFPFDNQFPIAEAKTEIRTEKKEKKFYDRPTSLTHFQSTNSNRKKSANSTNEIEMTTFKLS